MTENHHEKSASVCDYRAIEYSKNGCIATITFNRPKQLNPLDLDAILEVIRCLDDIERDKSIEILVLRATGRAFSAGGNLLRYSKMLQDADAMRQVRSSGRSLMERIEGWDGLVVAVVQGICVAAALELILCCDYVLATEKATFSDGHLNFGLVAGVGGSQRLPRAVGMVRAKDIVFTARAVSAEEAAAIGLVTRTVATERVEDELQSLLDVLCSKGFNSRRISKYLFNQGARLPIEAGMELAASEGTNYMLTDPDVREGLEAFAERRKPRFRRRSEGNLGR